MGSLGRSLLLVMLLLLASCNRSSADRLESLVGAKDLPAEAQLSKETIEIVPASAPGAQSANLYYDLRPDNSLTVTMSHWTEKAHGEEIDGRDTFHLSDSDASQARRLLWRLRPQDLTGIESLTLPQGCPAPPADASPLYSVGFIAEGPKPGLKDDLVGITAVPTDRYCSAKSGAEARQLIQQVLDLFPKSRVAAAFEHHRRAQTS